MANPSLLRTATVSGLAITAPRNEPWRSTMPSTRFRRQKRQGGHPLSTTEHRHATLEIHDARVFPGDAVRSHSEQASVAIKTVGWRNP